MALQTFDCKGFGQIEPSQTWFNRAGMVEAQCHLNPDEFASNFPMTAAEAADGKIYAENGAFLMVDKPNKMLCIPSKDLSDLGYKMGINYSTEKIYNQFTPGRRNFCMIAGEYLPRIGFIESGMRICTNTVMWDDTVYPVNSSAPASPSVQMYQAVKTALATNPETPIYAFVTDDSQGKLVIGADVDDAIGNVYAQVVQAYTNADTTLAFKIMFIDKPTA